MDQPKTRAPRTHSPGTSAQQSREWRTANPEKARELRDRYERSVRARVFDHYGWACACCGSTSDPEIDHINGDGKEHRLEALGPGRRAGHKFYLWLIRSDFPDGFQTLCRPCNISKGKGERCRRWHEHSAVHRVWIQAPLPLQIRDLARARSPVSALTDPGVARRARDRVPQWPAHYYTTTAAR